MFVVRDRECGNVIDLFDTKEAAISALIDYEAEDMDEDVYTEDFYEVAEVEDEVIHKGWRS